MNKRILFIVSITTFIIILTGFSVLTMVNRKMIHEAIKEQVIMDSILRSGNKRSVNAPGGRIS
jgi:hypothetical protein